MDGVDVTFQINSVDAQDEGFVTVQLNGKTVELKVDTGAKCNVLPQKTFMQVSTRKDITLQKTDANLVAYGGSKIETMGLAMLSCYLKEQHHTIPFFVVDSDVQPLLGFRACGHRSRQDEPRCSPGHNGQQRGFQNTDSQTIKMINKDVFDDKLRKLPVTLPH